MAFSGGGGSRDLRSPDQIQFPMRGQDSQKYSVTHDSVQSSLLAIVLSIECAVEVFARATPHAVAALQACPSGHTLGLMRTGDLAFRRTSCDCIVFSILHQLWKE